jgi:hypothetical protein
VVGIGRYNENVQRFQEIRIIAHRVVHASPEDSVNFAGFMNMGAKVRVVAENMGNMRLIAVQGLKNFHAEYYSTATDFCNQKTKNPGIFMFFD